MDGSFDKLKVEPSTSESTTSVSSASSSTLQRSLVTKRRNELMEKISRSSPSRNSPTKQQATVQDYRYSQTSTPEKQSKDDNNAGEKQNPLSPPKLREGLNSIDNDNKVSKTIPDTSFSTPSRQQNRHVSDGHQQQQQQQQQQREDEECSSVNFYRIVYRGIVGLLSDVDDSDSPNKYRKTGAYLGYGEIIASSSERLIEDTTARPQRRIHSSPRLGSAVDSPILAKVWDTKDQEDEEQRLRCASPPRSLVSGSSSGVSSFTNFTPKSEIKMRKVIRVDRVLTGGYAVDANEHEKSNGPPSTFSTNVLASDSTPKRGNTQSVADIVVPRSGSSLLPISDNHSIIQEVKTTHDNDDEIEIVEMPKPKHGYIFSEESNILVALAIPIEVVPKCEHGRFMYRVISSTPPAILTGPCLDAPRSKGILIPGTIHEVCLRVTVVDEGKQPNNSSSVTFLRLTRRRGWVVGGKNIVKKRNNSEEGTTSWIQYMKEIQDDELDGCGLSVVSRSTSKTNTSLLTTPISVANRRHRPPRRKRGGRKDVIEPNLLPRHVVGPSLQQGNDTSGLTDTSTNTSMNNSQHHGDPRSIMSPSSNISLLSDDNSSVDAITNKSVGGTLSPDRSVARSAASTSLQPSFFLMRVNAPRGLKILDAPHFQVNNLIHGNHATTSSNLDGFSSSSATLAKDLYGKGAGGGNQSIFHTMTGHHTTTMTSKTSNPAVFDSITKSRRLPRGSIFEASKRMEASNAFSQGAGLVKLSDNSGWAIIPRQTELNDQFRGYSGALVNAREREAIRAFDEVGNSLGSSCQETIFLRVVSRGGVTVSLPPIPNTESDVDTSPTSSATGSSVVSAVVLPPLNAAASHDSDVVSSVGSSFLDSMFRTPRRKERMPESINENKRDHQHHHKRQPAAERQIISNVIPCGTCLEVDRWVDPSEMEHYVFKNEFARIRGGQGWIPRFSNGKPIVQTITPPDFRFGSFWFRVSDQRGIKVRLGPSRKAPSIKSDDGVYFRFECGEFLRASEIVTFFKHNAKHECFAKLYRNRHVRLHAGELRPLSSLTAQAEWVQVFGENDVFLEECETEPRIERHRQGWRYNVVLDARVTVRKGPSFEADTEGVVLLGGESVLVNERVTGPEDTITWLRLKDGHGWVHTIGQNGESLMIAHSLRHRMPTLGRPTKAGRTKQEDIAYNTIVARLFHNDVPGESPPRHAPRK